MRELSSLINMDKNYYVLKSERKSFWNIVQFGYLEHITWLNEQALNEACESMLLDGSD